MKAAEADTPSPRQKHELAPRQLSWVLPGRKAALAQTPSTVQIGGERECRPPSRSANDFGISPIHSLILLREQVASSG